MKKSRIIKAAVIVIALIAVVVSAIAGAQQTMVDCETCHGSGKVNSFDCAECYGKGLTCADCGGLAKLCKVCEGEGTVEDETCTECKGEKAGDVACETCDGTGKGDVLCSTCEGKMRLTLAEVENDESLLNLSAYKEDVCWDCNGMGQVEAASDYYATFVSLIPPIIAILLALVTKEVYSSLFIGIIIAALFATNFKPVAAMDTMMSVGIIGAVQATAGIFVFLVVLGVFVALINKAGGSAAFGAWAEKHIKSRIGAMFATFILGVLIFIDDYFNCLTVGSVMRPVTDRHKISRAKLSYLIDATAAPICMIAPISSWAAAVTEYAPEGEGISLFVKAIPYNFYSLLTFVFIIFITIRKIDFGPMKLHELNAKTKGDLFTSGAKMSEDEEESVGNAKIIDLIFPVVMLIILCVMALIYVGGYFGTDIWGGTDNAGSFIGAFGNTDATFGLPWGAIIALVITIAYFMVRKLITFKDAMEAIPKGFVAMVPAILILTFAVALKEVNLLMGYDVFVANILEGAGALMNLLPAVVFVIACVLAFATGTSWGTFGILIPIVVSAFASDPTLQIIGMSACLAGAVCGDHCSPISDTTIMSSAGAKCDHLNHVSTQLPYAITVAVVSFVSFILAGYIQNWYIVFPISVVLMIATILVINKISNSGKPVQNKMK